MSLLATGAGVKNLAIGAAILGALLLAVWVVRKGNQVLDATAEGAGFLFGTNKDSTLGTWLYDVLNRPDLPANQIYAKWGITDEAQAIKTCNLLWKNNGEVRGEVCQYLRDAGKLTPP